MLYAALHCALQYSDLKPLKMPRVVEGLAEDMLEKARGRVLHPPYTLEVPPERSAGPSGLLGAGMGVKAFRTMKIHHWWRHIFHVVLLGSQV